MNSIIYEYLLRLKLGEIQWSGNIAMVPIFSENESGLNYLALDEAINRRLLVVTEVCISGSVPELKVINNADLPVLLLDGEELLGAKQNRILNTTILVKERSETVIPVSCCESGRWQYASRDFAASPEIMPASIRQKKLHYVNNSLRVGRRYLSQQGDVWNDINEVHQRSGVDSPTHAMKDAFDFKASQLEEYIKAFPLQPEQKGLLFFANGEILGFDIVSQASAYKVLHPKLIRSYTLDIPSAASKKVPSLKQAQSFISKASICNESQYPSPGYGLDFRYEDTTVIGSVLLHQENVIHAAFFQTDNPASNTSDMAGYRRRANLHHHDSIID